ncbi:MAG TPA: NAD(P)/FAD-dependent oxidoreductase, partial [Chloroflexia bacterium]|nr:NAD(P)/FAD-dependent oxidoreductase [Chloroflexia bacterium]
MSTVTSPRYDVIVVGAGPAGSASAYLFARQGYRVLMLDRARFPRDKACGEYTSPETEKVLTRLGALDLVLSLGGRRLPRMRVIGPSGKSFTMDYNHGLPEGPHVLATRRKVLDAALVEHAARAGVEVREGVKVEAVTLSNGTASGVVVKDRAGSQHEEQARLVIGADGVHSAVVRSLGLSAPLRWPRNLGMVAHYSNFKGLDEWGEMHVGKQGYAGLAPQSAGLLNVGLVMPVSSSLRLAGKSAAERFEAFAMSFPGVRPALEGAERVSPVRGVGPIGARVRRTSGAGYMLVGDAAGFFDPFTGEGVHKALRGAELAAEVGSEALARGDVSAKALAKYSVSRRREFAAKELVCRLVQSLVV